MPKGFYALIAAQFASGLADNVLMILGIFFLQEQGYPGWWAPLLKFSFNLAYVALASVVGPVADALPKAPLMAAMNWLKSGSVVLLLLGLHPLLAFALSGLAAAIYAPAKYAIVTESVHSSLLVRANAWLEVSVVMSVLLGIALGGWLIGEGHPIQITTLWPMVSSLAPIVSTQALPAFLTVLLIYGLSIILNSRVGETMSSKVHARLRPSALTWRAFWACHLKLWRDPLGGISLYVTTLFWGAGAVLQFAVLLWAQSEMGLSLQQGAYLQALVAVGVVCGAFLAARSFKIFNARHVLPWGILLSVLMPLMAYARTLWLAMPLLIVSGSIAGMLLVPMNALLQHRGAKILSPGRSVAVQGFNENLSVLIMLGAYSTLLAIELPLQTIMLILGLLLLCGLVSLQARMKPRKRRLL